MSAVQSIVPRYDNIQTTERQALCNPAVDVRRSQSYRAKGACEGADFNHLLTIKVVPFRLGWDDTASHTNRTVIA